MIEINITKEDALNSRGYNSNFHCVLATAMRRQLGEDDVRVGSETGFVNEDKYSIVNSFLERDHDAVLASVKNDQPSDFVLRSVILEHLYKLI